jgi:hypothetical protein
LILFALFLLNCTVCSGKNSPPRDGGVDSARDIQNVSFDTRPSVDTIRVSEVWRPKPLTTWQWQLSGNVDTSIDVAMYDIDLFDSDASLIGKLKAAGRVVICYFSAGSYEAWRSDASSFPKAVKGEKMAGWDELWLDVRETSVRDAMKLRLDLATSKGCDGVEPDNVDGYANKTGFPLTAADQKNYLKFLAAEAHGRGLSIGLKNTLDLAADVEGDFDWALNEECIEHNECDKLAVFIAANKAVFNAEYIGTKESICPKATAFKLSTLIKKKDLGVWYEACW